MISSLGPFIIILLLIFPACTRFTDKNPQITERELIGHIEYLSSDSLKGRPAGSPYDSLAAEYIKKDLASNGLVPPQDGGFQKFKVLKRLVPGTNNYLSFNGIDYTAGKDFVPVSFSADTLLVSEVVFAGYGFKIDTDSLKWDDYKDIDIRGKWVMVLRSDPEQDKPGSPFEFYSSDREKVLRAKDMGAGGVILVSGPVYDQADDFDPLAKEDYPAGIAVIRVKRYVADLIIAGKKITTGELERKLNTYRQPSGFRTGIILSAETEIIRERSSARNVVMLLPGEDEILKDEYVIIGAHFDHIGMGGTGSSSRAADTTAIHPGADDNASGVSMMLELAEKFSATKGDNKRSILFIGFSGEELGLLGSKYFAEHPWADLTNVSTMINLDMVGRLQETNILQVTGVGTAEGLKEVVLASTDTSEVRMTFSEEGYGPSDHSSFYGKNIPVLFYSTGVHNDYHTPTDKPEKINVDGMVKISQYVYNAAMSLANSPEPLKFRESGPRTGTTGVMRRKGVTLGIMPDFAGNVKNGLRADFVTPGKPADMAGMKKGDIIISIEGKEINNIQDYMSRMNQLKKGQTITVEVLRDKEKKTLVVQL